MDSALAAPCSLRPSTASGEARQWPSQRNGTPPRRERKGAPGSPASGAGALAAIGATTAAGAGERAAIRQSHWQHGSRVSPAAAAAEAEGLRRAPSPVTPPSERGRRGAAAQEASGGGRTAPRASASLGSAAGRRAQEGLVKKGREEAGGAREGEGVALAGRRRRSPPPALLVGSRPTERGKEGGVAAGAGRPAKGALIAREGRPASPAELPGASPSSGGPRSHGSPLQVASGTKGAAGPSSAGRPASLKERGAAPQWAEAALEEGFLQHPSLDRRRIRREGGGGGAAEGAATSLDSPQRQQQGGRAGAAAAFPASASFSTILAAPADDSPRPESPGSPAWPPRGRAMDQRSAGAAAALLFAGGGDGRKEWHEEQGVASGRAHEAAARMEAWQQLGRLARHLPKQRQWAAAVRSHADPGAVRRGSGGAPALPVSGSVGGPCPAEEKPRAALRFPQSASDRGRQTAVGAAGGRAAEEQRPPAPLLPQPSLEWLQEPQEEEDCPPLLAAESTPQTPSIDFPASPSAGLNGEQHLAAISAPCSPLSQWRGASSSVPAEHEGHRGGQGGQRASARSRSPCRESQRVNCPRPLVPSPPSRPQSPEPGTGSHSRSALQDHSGPPASGSSRSLSPLRAGPLPGRRHGSPAVRAAFPLSQSTCASPLAAEGKGGRRGLASSGSEKPVQQGGSARRLAPPQADAEAAMGDSSDERRQSTQLRVRVLRRAAANTERAAGGGAGERVGGREHRGKEGGRRGLAADTVQRQLVASYETKALPAEKLAVLLRNAERVLAPASAGGKGCWTHKPAVAGSPASTCAAAGGAAAVRDGSPDGAGQSRAPTERANSVRRAAQALAGSKGGREKKACQRHVLQQAYEDVGCQFALSKGELGSGQYGVIRRCMEIDSGKIFACKTIKKSSIRSRSDAEDIFKEVACLRMLQPHPHIVELKAAVEDTEAVHIVMEMCGGGDLFDRIAANGAMSERNAARLCRALVEALLHCHSHGIVHRDVKPENILLVDRMSDTNIKLVDFGVATFVEPGTLISDVMGTPEYMAPEQIRGAYSFPADLWSAGVVAYIAVSGLPPFWASDRDAVTRAILEQEVKFKSPKWQTVSEDCKDLIRAMLEKDPEKRISASGVLRHQWIKRHQA